MNDFLNSGQLCDRVCWQVMSSLTLHTVFQFPWCTAFECAHEVIFLFFARFDSQLRCKQSLRARAMNKIENIKMRCWDEWISIEVMACDDEILNWI